jgi:hypothetical protein
MVLGATAVIAIALLSTGLVSVITVAASVTSVVDSQLSASMAAFANSVDRLRRIQQTDEAKGFKKPLIDFVGHPSGSVIALMHNGVIIDSASFSEQESVPCAATVGAQLVAGSTLGPRVETLQLEGLGEYRGAPLRQITQILVLTALGEGMIGGQIAAALEVPRETARSTLAHQIRIMRGF